MKMPVYKNAKIANIQFVLSILIVAIHSNCVFMNVPGKELNYVYGNNWASFIQLFLSEGIARIAVPLFFIISGYLFFNTFDGSSKEYGKKLKRRAFSLGIPYLFWSTFTFFAFFFVQKIPAIGEYFSTRNVTSLSAKVLFDNIIISSYNSPLWYVRYLIVFSVFSIVIYYAVKKLPFLFSMIVLMGWLFDFFGLPIPFTIRWDAVFFYLLGVEIALKKDLAIKLGEKLNNKWVLIVVLCLYISLQVIRTIILCNKNPNFLLNGEYDSTLHYLSAFGIMLGIFLIWFGWDYLFKSQKAWRVSEFTFFIFVTHHPIVNIIKKLLFKVVGYSIVTSFGVYMLTIGITVFLILSIGLFCKRYIRLIFNFICGGR